MRVWSAWSLAFVLLVVGCSSGQPAIPEATTPTSLDDLPGPPDCGGTGGTVYGRVATSDVTDLPLALVLVSIPEIACAHFTDATGMYMLRNVPDEPLTIQVERIGFHDERHQVVPAGDSIQVDFSLREKLIPFGDH